jgi:carboxyl-terminal processing protease
MFGMLLRRRFGTGTLLVAAGIFATATFGFGVIVGAHGIDTSRLPAFAASVLAKDTQPENVDFSPVWRAWHELAARYVPGANGTSTPVTDQDKVWGMIQGLAASYGDPYTVFLPPSEAEIFNDDISGSFEGVGMEIANRDGVLTVVSPLKGTPASEAGIRSGDIIVSIDGVSTKDISVDGAVRRIRGEKGTPVTFEIAREGEADLIEITVTRDVIDIPTIETELRSDGTFVIELLSFTAVSPELFRNALQEFVDSGSDELVLDLRGNPGGYLEAAVDMASWFLPAGKVVVTEDYGGNRDQVVHRSRGYDVFNDNLKMVILVDGGSASASEILAGALQQHGIAKLVGSKTFGKGSVQELIEITGDTSLKVTVARWLSPNGTQIPHEGITPDIEVERTIEDVEAEQDPQMDTAIETLRDWR